MADWLKDFMGSTPFAILGAIGLLSMASQFINLADDIENWLKVWKAVTRPVWEWIAGLVGFELPNWLKDYFTFGIIHGGMASRWFSTNFLVRNLIGNTMNGSGAGPGMSVAFVFVNMFLWPLYLLFFAYMTFQAINYRRFYRLHRYESDLTTEPFVGKRLHSIKEVFVELRRCQIVYIETGIYFAILIAASGALVLIE